MKAAMKTLYLIGGPMGVGKTTICRILKEQLDNCVFLDGDWCWDMHPFQVTEETRAMVLDNICHLLNSFLHCSAYDHILFCWVMHRQSIIDSILDRLDTAGCEVVKISLVCDGETLRKRLAKDVEAGLRKPDVLARSLERLPQYSSLHTIHLDTTHLAAAEAAKIIRRLPQAPSGADRRRPPMNYEILPMTAGHLDQAAEIEKLCFSDPWSRRMLAEHLENPCNASLTARSADGAVLGYVGLLVVLDEGHITNLAVHPEYRRRGVASALLNALDQLARERRLSFLTLEVRSSNAAARALYVKHGYQEAGLRKNYYEHPREDAVIMTRRFGEENTD